LRHVTRHAVAAVLLIRMTLQTTGPVICRVLLNIGVGIVTSQTGQFTGLEALAAIQPHYLIANVDEIVRISLGLAAMAGCAKRYESLWLQASWILHRGAAVGMIECARMATLALHSRLERLCPW
jgi:hypothetical protein